MTISELIIELQSIAAQHGDLPVKFYDGFSLDSHAAHFRRAAKLISTMRGLPENAPG